VAACQIERNVTDLAATLARARREAQKFRSRWEGDEKSGDYTLRTPLGTIEGRYAVSDGKVRFTIDEKPRLVPCALIERVLDQFLRAG
jgi:hypothetical protein